MQASWASFSGLSRALFCLLCVPLLLSCEAIWGGLSRSNHENCVVFPGNCNYTTEYCSPELEHCQPLGPPCFASGPAICAATGPDRICFADLGRCATNVLLDGVNPATGPVAGGVPITLLGQYFRAGMRVSIDGQPADIIEVVSSSKVVVKLPPSQSGQGQVGIRVEQADGGHSERFDLFSYGQAQVSFVSQPITVAYYGDEIDITDTNRDFNPDLISQLDSQLISARGDGSGGFMTSLLGPAEYTLPTTELETADIDNSGTPDLVFGAKHPISGTDGVIYTATNDSFGNLTLKQTLSLPSAGSVTRVALGDLDGDGKIDLLACHLTTASGFKIIVYPGIGSGQFSTTPTTVSFVNSLTFPQVTGLKVADLNHDNKMDFIVSGKVMVGTSAAMSGFVYSLSAGAGISMFDKFYDFGNLPASIFVRDMNNDSEEDVVASLDQGQFSSISVALADGGGSFRPPQQYSIGPSIKLNRIAPARLDQDGFPDVVLWDRSSPRVRFLLGNGDGSLRAQDFELVLPQNPSSLRPSDLNGDNHGDVVVAFGSSRPIQAFLGQ
jgi:hypothetical protein